MKNKSTNFIRFLGKTLAIITIMCIYVIPPIVILGATWYVLAPIFWWEKFLTLLLSLILPVIYEIIMLIILVVLYDN